jgi:hypothetical protein
MPSFTTAAIGGQLRLRTPSPTIPTPPNGPRLTARALTALLWGIGSAYLVQHEAASAAPNLIVMASTPALWAAVIALPVLAHRALHERQHLAAALLTIAALIGSAYTLSNTLGQRSEARDAGIDTAAETKAARDRLASQIRENEDQLAGAQRNFARECSSGPGRNCAGIEKVIGLYTATLRDQRRDLKGLLAGSPQAGERRIAAVLALITGRSESDMLAAVGLVLPALFGLLLEFAALACAMYGWSVRPTCKHSLQVAAEPSDLTGQSDYPAISHREAADMAAIVRPDDSGPSGGQRQAPSRPTPKPDASPAGRSEVPARRSKVIEAMIADLSAGRTFTSQRELSERFDVPRSTLSDWLREAERSGEIPARRTVGRCKVVKA